MPLFDRLPVWAQHLTVGLAVTVLGWVGTDYVPVLEGKSPAVAGLVGTIVTLALGALTPLTRQYGRGAEDPATLYVNVKAVDSPADVDEPGGP